MKKVTVATCSLAGCFGCHMSFLDMDESLITLIKHIEFNRSPLTDIKTLSPCDIGLIEGGLCNIDNVKLLQNFREKCKILVAVGACAINGGVPALRNHFTVKECMEEAYLNGPHINGSDISNIEIVDPQIPNDPELPKLLEKVQPIHEQVTVDYFLPGCPPPAAAFTEIINAIIEDRDPILPPEQRLFE